MAGISERSFRKKSLTDEKNGKLSNWTVGSAGNTKKLTMSFAGNFRFLNTPQIRDYVKVLVSLKASNVEVNPFVYRALQAAKQTDLLHGKSTLRVSLVGNKTVC